MPDPTADRAALLDFLAERDIDCPVCAYQIRGLTSERCPECGASLRLQVGSLDLRLGPWLTGLLSIALPFGLFAIILAIFLIDLVFDSGRSRGPGLGRFILGVVVYGSGLAAMIGVRRRFWSRRRQTQVRFAVAIALVSATVAGVLLWPAMYG